MPPADPASCPSYVCPIGATCPVPDRFECTVAGTVTLPIGSTQQLTYTYQSAAAALCQ